MDKNHKKPVQLESKFIDSDVIIVLLNIHMIDSF